MQLKLIMIAILLALVTTLTVAMTATTVETGNPQQKAYAVLCPGGYHWDDDANACVHD